MAVLRVAAVAVASFAGVSSLKVTANPGDSWTLEPCDQQPQGVPCKHPYEHPQGSSIVMPCPADQQSRSESCAALVTGIEEGEKCPQLVCPKALGVTMKLVCGGSCCPTCWAPDHVVALDRHTNLENPAVVDPHPAAPTSCGGVRCFEPVCGEGFKKGHVQGD